MSLDEAAAYARRARGPRRRPDHGWGSLTPAELEVVRLAVDGLTNPEIGARLFMSRSTVKTHLSHVYAKLGVANRTELAAQAPDEAKRRASVLLLREERGTSDELNACGAGRGTRSPTITCGATSSADPLV